MLAEHFVSQPTTAGDFACLVVGSITLAAGATSRHVQRDARFHGAGAIVAKTAATAGKTVGTLAPTKDKGRATKDEELSLPRPLSLRPLSLVVCPSSLVLRPCQSGSAYATYASPDLVPILPPPAAITTYCLPLTTYVLGVA